MTTIESVSTNQLRSSLNAFKMATEAAFQKLSTDISNLGRDANFSTDPNARMLIFEGLQEQLRNIRNSFHTFNFGIDDPLIEEEKPNEDDVVIHRTEYDRDPLGTAKKLRNTRAV